MAIKMMCEPDAPGARLDEYWSKDSPRPVYVRTFAVGCVVSLREANGYHDSDFYATYFDPEADEFRTILYATTRGWSYPNGAAVDATPEVAARWTALVEREARVRYVRRRLAKRGRENAEARAAGFAGRRDPALRRLQAAIPPDRAESVLSLLGSYRAGRLRSAFRKSLAAQIDAWVTDPAPRYPSPLSGRQLRYL